MDGGVGTWGQAGVTGPIGLWCGGGGPGFGAGVLVFCVYVAGGALFPRGAAKGTCKVLHCILTVF